MKTNLLLYIIYLLCANLDEEDRIEVSGADIPRMGFQLERVPSDKMRKNIFYRNGFRSGIHHHRQCIHGFVERRREQNLKEVQTHWWHSPLAAVVVVASAAAAVRFAVVVVASAEQ